MMETPNWTHCSIGNEEKKQRGGRDFKLTYYIAISTSDLTKKTQKINDPYHQVLEIS